MIRFLTFETLHFKCELEKNEIAEKSEYSVFSRDHQVLISLRVSQYRLFFNIKIILIVHGLIPCISGQLSVTSEWGQ